MRDIHGNWIDFDGSLDDRDPESMEPLLPIECLRCKATGNLPNRYLRDSEYFDTESFLLGLLAGSLTVGIAGLVFFWLLPLALERVVK